ncbi:hypothetical protein Cni_G09565 [Canna indica]|uniref:Reverse transcriptase domain-containing protein n=1 Tax=Canna indica TaxID=4628 RepID=A0AAQ3K2U4_9LILI|nr:hypothetical protein Cni_G09565 [Canna indica]
MPISEPVSIICNFASWYKELWKVEDRETFTSEWQFPKSLKWNKISSSKKRSLCKNFTDMEIWSAVNSLGRGKAPEPDGFNVKFYIKYWDIFKDSILLAIQEFTTTAHLPDSWGDTNLNFIPKKEGPAKIIDYMPIALCNALYKILPKAIVNRLQLCMKQLVSQEQCAFIRGKKIHDNILITNEIVNIVKQGNIKYFRYKDMKLSHLAVADDLLIIIKGNPNNYSNVLKAINLYCSLTDQRVSKAIFEIFFPMHCLASVKDEVRKILEFKEGTYPMKYLGALIGAKKPDTSSQETILHKAINKSDGWASKSISQAGRMTLLNYVMNFLPIHIVSSSWVNSKTINRFQSLAKNYLWNSKANKKSLHLMGWDKIMLKKGIGGLGIKDLGILKLSIHAKKILPFLNKDKSLWARILNKRYEDYHPWFYRNVNKFSWHFKCLYEAILVLRDGLRMRVGNGAKINLWRDPWLSSTPIGK